MDAFFFSLQTMNTIGMQASICSVHYLI